MTLLAIRTGGSFIPEKFIPLGPIFSVGHLSPAPFFPVGHLYPRPVFFSEAGNKRCPEGGGEVINVAGILKHKQKENKIEKKNENQSEQTIETQRNFKTK